MKEYKMKNVHEFDGKIRIKTTCNEIEKHVFEDFLKRPLNPRAKEMALDIIQDSSTKNRDDINQADAKMVFYELLEKIQSQKPEDKESMYLLLEEQLADSQTLGPCAQGRTIRLWQLLKCFE